MLASWVAQARGVKLAARWAIDALGQRGVAGTRICYVTEGTLLRQMLADPQLTASAR